MLKIKDEIDLKELEKFGYKDCNKTYEKSVMADRNSGAWTWFETIVIDKDDRIIRSKLFHDCNCMTWWGFVGSTEHYLYDLEKAGMVEEARGYYEYNK